MDETPEKSAEYIYAGAEGAKGNPLISQAKGRKNFIPYKVLFCYVIGAGDIRLFFNLF